MWNNFHPDRTLPVRDSAPAQPKSPRLGRTFATPFLTSTRRKQTSFNLTTIFLSRRYREQSNPTQHCPEPPPCQMSFSQQQPVATRMLRQPSSSLHQPLLQTGQRPILNPSRQTQPPPQIPHVVSQQAQCQPHLI